MTKNKKKKITIMTIGIILLIGIIVCVPYQNINYISNETKVKTNALAYNTDDFIYLSDIDYVANQSSTGWGNILKDVTSNNTKIQVKIDNAAYSFDKGMWAHATSTLVYDLRNYDYAYFTSYIGLNTTSTKGNGVTFYIYTSNDGTNWEQKEKIEKLPGQNAEFVKVDIKEASYLKLVANDNGANGQDHSVYADAKLIKEDYSDDAVESLEVYDEKIKALGEVNLSNQSHELLVLQRNFIKNAGEFTLKRFVNESSENKAAFEWLFNNVENLRLYTMGGKPTGSYYNSLDVLKKLLVAHKSDFDIQQLTKYGNKYGDLYKRMAIALSLTHSAQVALWMQPSAPENQSNAVTRYEIYKDLHKNNKFVVSADIDIAKWFENYNIEEMRFVMNNLLDDEEIVWLNEYTQSQIDAHPNQIWSYLTPHPYMAYVWPNYSNPVFHDATKKDYWDKKYNGIFSKYKVTYKYGLYKVWMNFRNEFGTGAVCGGISKTGHNIRGVHGIPAAVIGQPGHAAIIYYTQDNNGNGYWNLDNDVSGWTLSEKSERMLLGWGNESYQRGYSVVYMALAQEVLNNDETFEASQKYVILADSYQDLEKKERYYREALKIQPYNINAWYGLITTYNASESKTEDEYYELAKEIGENMKYFPLPMTHLTNLIKPKLTSVANEYKFTLLQTRILTEGTKVPNNSDENYYVYQPSLTRLEANYLLGKLDKTIATFSFDGENAEKIVLSDRFAGNGVRWDYSLDGGNTWTEVAFTAEEEHKLKLSKAEVAKITAENDIKIHIVGVNYDEENIYTIDITTPTISKDVLFGNDLENRVIGVNTTYEWRRDETEKWTSYAKASPDNTGNKKLQVRTGATGTSLPSNVLEFSFTEDNQSNKRKYISVSHLSIEGVSTEATAHQGHAKNSIDGNYNTRYHSAWNGSDTQRFVTIKLDKSRYISAVEFVPASGGNGKIYDGTVYGSMDGENWEVLSSMKNITYTNQANTVDDAIANTKSFEVENPREVLYVKIVADRSNANWFAARAFNLYQDLTSDPRPTAGIGYDKTTPTNQNVLARLINPSTNITITNNGGSDTYVFTENGEFTFEFVDADGNVGTSTAKVDWIDREAPTANVEYSITSPTNQEVVATLTDASEEIIILNNNGRDNYTFNENGTFTFEIQDLAGNKSKIEATVDWIDTEIPDVSISYDIKMETNGNVVATVVSENKEIVILNNDGNRSYTFTDNGTFIFIIQDQAGNVVELIAKVDWINRTLPTAEIEYSTTENTKDAVIATLKNPSKPITIINNDGKDSYTFTKNGTFIFMIKDELGNIGNVIAKVDWIQTDEDSNEENPNPDDDNKPSGSVSVSGSPTITQDVFPNQKPNNTNNNVSSGNNNQSNKQENWNQNIENDNDVSDEEEKPEEDSNDENESEYYKVGNVTLKAPAKISEEKVVLKSKDIAIPNAIKEKVTEQSEYFELYFETENNKVVNINSVPMTMTLKTDNTKKMVGIYEVKENNRLVALSYQKLGNSQVELNINQLGKYIIAYEDLDKKDQQETVDNNQKEVETENKNIYWILASGALVLVLATVFVIKKR